MSDLKPCGRCQKPTANTCITCKNPLCPGCADSDPMCRGCRDKVQEGNGSEVARLLEIIDAEYRSAQQGLYGLASGTSKHEFITKRVENIERFRERIVDLVGDEQKANELVMDQLDKAGQQEPEEPKGEAE